MTKLSKTITLNELNSIEFEATCPRCDAETTIGLIGHHSCENCGLVIEYTASTYIPSDLEEINEHRDNHALEPLSESDIPSWWMDDIACVINEFRLGRGFKLKTETSLPFDGKPEPR